MSADSIEVVEIAEGISGEIGSHLQRMKEIAEEAVSSVLILPVGENKEQNTDIKSLAHTKWNCKYHVVFAIPFCGFIFLSRVIKMSIRNVRNLNFQFFA